MRGGIGVEFHRSPASNESPAKGKNAMQESTLNNMQLTALGDGSSNSQVTVFLVHVVSTTSRIITNPDPKVLDSARFLLVHLENLIQILALITQK
jgi:hypothetical protein